MRLLWTTDDTNPPSSTSRSPPDSDPIWWGAAGTGQQHDRIHHYTLAWFDRWLKNDPAANQQLADVTGANTDLDAFILVGGWAQFGPEAYAATCEQLRPRAASNDVRLDSRLPATFPVRADRRRLEQVLTNLVDNAIKFNKPGGEVRIGGRVEADRRILEVEDTGTGIPSESREKIFHRFYRVDPDRSREAGGTGLGLAIVKHLVQAMGGGVYVESEPGRGSTFRLTLPRADRRPA